MTALVVPSVRLNTGRIAGHILAWIFVLFMAFDIVIKLIRLPVVGETMIALGWPPDAGFWIGALELAIVALYLWPRTALLGAVLFTGVLGGAVATHLRIGSPLFSHVLFSVYLGVFMWGGLYLREPGLRALFPLRRE